LCLCGDYVPPQIWCGPAILSCYFVVCVLGTLAKGSLKTSVDNRDASERHLMYDLVYTVWCTSFGLINGAMNMMQGTINMKIIRSSTSLH
jgi:hypothetical protein